MSGRPDRSEERSPPRPIAIYRDVEAFLGEALREILSAGTPAGPTHSAVRTLALTLAFGRPAVAQALTLRLESRGSRTRIGLRATRVIGAAVAREIAPAVALPLGVFAAAAGIGWLATMRRVTPLRRRYAEHVSAARRTWESDRRAWLAGDLTRPARESAVDTLLTHLCHTLQTEEISPSPTIPPTIP